MWPDRRLCELFTIEHPIIQAPMAGSATPELAAAVSESGGLGSVAFGEASPDQIREAAEAMRGRTSRPFNFNFFVHPAPDADLEVFRAARERLAPWYDRLGLGTPPERPAPPKPGFDAETLALLLDIRPPVVSFHFGVPAEDAVAALKAIGVKLISTASTVAEAVELERCGMDAVIAQGWEAGGHRGSHTPTSPDQGVGTMALVPQVVSAVSIPVIAAGGIGDGRGIAAAFALGASGVQMGTAFLSCPEAATSPAWRELLRHARETDSIVTDSISGRSARWARSRYAEAMERERRPLPGFPALFGLTAPICSAGADEEANFYLYGQAVTLNRELPAAELIATLVGEAQAVFARLSPTNTS